MEWLKQGICCLLALLIVAIQTHAVLAEDADFPSRPIVVLVYTTPGGPIDLMARKYVDIAARHSEAAMVVENVSGAGGIVAVHRLLEAPADGHTLLACTKSVVAKLVATGGGAYLDAMHWAAMMMADPECVITHRGSGVESWADLSTVPNVPQLWVGPARGGLDHVTAVKIWEEFQIEGKWIPFDSGSLAVNALLGDQGVAYVGNPREALANPDLQVVAVASPQRLPQFPDVPTMHELGSERLIHEFMWRGFALRKGTPAPIVAWHDRLFQAVARDPDWRAAWEEGGVDVVYEGEANFSDRVELDRQEFEEYLTQFGILSQSQFGQETEINRSLITLGLLTLLLFALVYWVARRGQSDRMGEVLIPAVVSCLALYCWVDTNRFPTNEGVGPSAVPRLWIGLMLPLAAWLAYRGLVAEIKLTKQPAQLKRLAVMGVLLLCYLLAIPGVGYVLASALFLIAAMWVLGVRRMALLVSVPLGWSMVAYWGFVQQMHIPLPTGRLFDGWL